MARWANLPYEIRYMIWTDLAADTRRKKNLRWKTRVKPPAEGPIETPGNIFFKKQARRGLYALVCREWHAFFEQVYLRHIVLSPARVNELNKIIPRGKRHLVKHIWLRAELPEHVKDATYSDDDDYDYSVKCQEEEDANAFTETLRGLFRSLAEWSVRNRQGREVTLELSVHSPSDIKYHCWSLNFNAFEWTGNECFDHHREAELFLAAKHDRGMYEWAWSNRLHGTRWRDDLEEEICLLNAKLCRVPVVTRLLIRRRNYHNIPSGAIGEIVRNLPELEQIQYGMWRIDQPHSQVRHRGHTDVFRKLRIPPNLKRISLFEDFHMFDLHRQRWHHHVIHPPLGQALAGVSSQLEEVSLAFLVEAEDFFYEFFPPETNPPNDGANDQGEQNQKKKQQYWRNLKSLAITSTLISQDNYRPSVLESEEGVRRSEWDDLLEAAACALAAMPKLEILEIWNGDDEEGAIFRYQSNAKYEGSPRITWCASWTSRLHPGVVRAWREAVNQQHPLRGLVVEIEDMDKPKTHGSVLSLLKLRSLVVDEVSLYQLECEAAHPARKRY